MSGSLRLPRLLRRVAAAGRATTGGGPSCGRGHGRGGAGCGDCPPRRCGCRRPAGSGCGPAAAGPWLRSCCCRSWLRSLVAVLVAGAVAAVLGVVLVRCARRSCRWWPVLRAFLGAARGGAVRGRARVCARCAGHAPRSASRAAAPRAAALADWFSGCCGSPARWRRLRLLPCLLLAGGGRRSGQPLWPPFWAAVMASTSSAFFMAGALDPEAAGDLLELGQQLGVQARRGGRLRTQKMPARHRSSKRHRWFRSREVPSHVQVPRALSDVRLVRQCAPDRLRPATDRVRTARAGSGKSGVMRRSDAAVDRRAIRRDAFSQ